MKRQTLKQRRSLAAKKGWETRREKASVSLPGFDLMTYEKERLNALSNGPPNIERDTDYSPAEPPRKTAYQRLLAAFARIGRP